MSILDRPEDSIKNAKKNDNDFTTKLKNLGQFISNFNPFTKDDLKIIEECERLPISTNEEEEKYMQDNDNMIKKLQQYRDSPSKFKLKPEDIDYELPKEAYILLQQETIVIIRSKNNGISYYYDNVYTSEGSELYNFCKLITENDKNLEKHILKKAVESEIYYFLENPEKDESDYDYESEAEEYEVEFSFSGNTDYRSQRESDIEENGGVYYEYAQKEYEEENDIEESFNYPSYRTEEQMIEMRVLSDNIKGKFNQNENGYDKKNEDKIPKENTDDGIILRENVKSRKNNSTKSSWTEEIIDEEEENLVGVPLEYNKNNDDRLFSFNTKDMKYWKVKYNIWRLYLLHLSFKKNDAFLFLAFQNNSNRLLTHEGKQLFNEITKDNDFKSIPIILEKLSDTFKIINKHTEKLKDEYLDSLKTELSDTLITLQNTVNKITIFPKSD